MSNDFDIKLKSAYILKIVISTHIGTINISKVIDYIVGITDKKHAIKKN